MFAAILEEIEKREAAQAITPDPIIAAYMREAAKEVRGGLWRRLNTLLFNRSPSRVKRRPLPALACHSSRTPLMCYLHPRSRRPSPTVCMQRLSARCWAWTSAPTLPSAAPCCAVCQVASASASPLVSGSPSCCSLVRLNLRLSLCALGSSVSYGDSPTITTLVQI